MSQEIRIDHIAHGFMSFHEFQHRNGIVQNDSLVELMHSSVLERQSNAASKQYWLDEMTSGADQEATVMVGFIEPEESIFLDNFFYSRL